MMAPETSSQVSSSSLTISVVLPVRDGGISFRRCLSGLNKVRPHLTEIIVVADGDTDGSWRVAEEFGTKVLRISESQGPARARNLGAQAAQGDILLFIDADVEIHPDAIQQIESSFRGDPNLAALFGSYDDEPGEDNFLSQYKNLFHHYVHQMSREEASTFWSGCGAIRRNVFMELGGFDASYRKPCVEDIELGYRLKQAGYRIRLSKKLQVKHLKRWGVSSLLKSDFFHRALPWTELILKDRRFINDLNLRPSSRLSVLLTYALLLTLSSAWWWSGFLWVAAVSAFSLLALNRSLYQFFLHKRGFWFMAKTIPWHWLYYFYSGLAFGIGLGHFFFSRLRATELKFSTIPKRMSDSTPFLEGR